MAPSNNFNDMIFLAAPREMSAARFKQIVKHYLPKASLVVGISKESYVAGFEDQPQFRMLERSFVQPLIDKVNAAAGPRRIEVLEYGQSELASLVAEYAFKRVLLVNGSWKYTFQNHPAYKVLVERDIPFKYISPFIDEREAKEYEAIHSPMIDIPAIGTTLTEAEMLNVAAASATQSYDYSFQTGVSLGRREGDCYSFLLEAFNKVVPYQTYALHHGNAREKHVSGVHDTAHYDTIHAEMYLLTKAIAGNVHINGTTLFINLLPCPSCARTLSQTDIGEIVYQNDHSDGYAVALLKASGKTVRRIKTAQGTVY